MINRTQDFQYPAIQTQQIQPNTPSIPGQVDTLAQNYGNQLNSSINRPQTSFNDFLSNQGKDPAAKSFAQKTWPNYSGGWDTLPKYLQDEALYHAGPGSPMDIQAPDELNQASQYFRDSTNVRPAYDASLAEAQRQFSTYAIPQLNENFGRRGLRYSSALNDSATRSFGDVQAKLGSEAAQRQITANQQAGTGLTSIGSIIAALRNQNQQRQYQEFLRTQPDAYYGASQAYLGGTKPIYPQVITGGQPILTQNPSQMDAANQYLQAIGNISGIIGQAM